MQLNSYNVIYESRYIIEIDMYLGALNSFPHTDAFMLRHLWQTTFENSVCVCTQEGIGHVYIKYHVVG